MGFFFSASSSPTHSSSSKTTTQHPTLRASALGLLRTYALLLPAELDFILARESHLLPSSSNFTWETWAPLLPHLLSIPDSSVSPRFHYGQLRLSRVNWAVRLFRPPSAETFWFYQLPRLGSTASYLREMSIPLLFVFAALSLALSSMQVVLSTDVEVLDLLPGLDGRTIQRAFVVCALMLLVFSAFVGVAMIFIPAGVLMWQLSWGFSRRRRNVKYHE